MTPESAPRTSSHDAVVSAQTLLGVGDALHRFAAGQDLRDRSLLESAFSKDADLDFSGPARLFGIDLAPFKSRDVVVTTVFANTEPLITTHTVTNVRLTEHDATSAAAYALVEAQHVLRDAPERRLMLKNHYWIGAVADCGVWRIRHMRIETAWYDGDPSVLFS